VNQTPEVEKLRSREAKKPRMWQVANGILGAKATCMADFRRAEENAVGSRLHVVDGVGGNEGAWFLTATDVG
jgi:hypothetical protein